MERIVMFELLALISVSWSLYGWSRKIDREKEQAEIRAEKQSWGR
jgi:hypothetical protein